MCIKSKIFLIFFNFIFILEAAVPGKIYAFDPAAQQSSQTAAQPVPGMNSLPVIAVSAGPSDTDDRSSAPSSGRQPTSSDSPLSEADDDDSVPMDTTDRGSLPLIKPIQTLQEDAESEIAALAKITFTDKMIIRKAGNTPPPSVPAVPFNIDGFGGNEPSEIAGDPSTGSGQVKTSYTDGVFDYVMLTTVRRSAGTVVFTSTEVWMTPKPVTNQPSPTVPDSPYTGLDTKYSSYAVTFDSSSKFVSMRTVYTDSKNPKNFLERTESYKETGPLPGHPSARKQNYKATETRYLYSVVRLPDEDTVVTHIESWTRTAGSPEQFSISDFGKKGFSWSLKVEKVNSLLTKTIMTDTEFLGGNRGSILSAWEENSNAWSREVLQSRTRRNSNGNAGPVEYRYYDYSKNNESFQDIEYATNWFKVTSGGLSFLEASKLYVSDFFKKSADVVVTGHWIRSSAEPEQIYTAKYYFPEGNDQTIVSYNNFLVDREQRHRQDHWFNRYDPRNPSFSFIQIEISHDIEADGNELVEILEKKYVQGEPVIDQIKLSRRLWNAAHGIVETEIKFEDYVSGKEASVSAMVIDDFVRLEYFYSDPDPEMAWDFGSFPENSFRETFVFGMDSLIYPDDDYLLFDFYGRLVTIDIPGEGEPSDVDYDTRVTIRAWKILIEALSSLLAPNFESLPEANAVLLGILNRLLQ